MTNHREANFTSSENASQYIEIIISYGEMPEEECYAYVGGQRIEDDDDVFGLMHHDLSVLEEASADVGLDVRTQMQMMGDVLETVEF